MYKGFNLKLEIDSLTFYETGLELYSEYKGDVRCKLKDLTDSDGILDGSMIQSDWFPQVNADIFLSHSHRDEKQAITLAGLLFKIFKIKTFIDSCVWGYANDLIKMLDDKFCITNGSYASASHVHMMLSTALLKMIDKTECLFFLNSPNSISGSDIVNKTQSPWIYSEIAMTQSIRTKEPSRYLPTQRLALTDTSKNTSKPPIRYNVELAHLIDIDKTTIKEWLSNKYKNSGEALDRLYSIASII